MEWKAYVNNKLAELSQKWNDIGTNAKKIDELTPQTNLDNSSKIHVSRSGESESITVQQILDTVETVSTQFLNQLVSIGNVTVVDNVITIPSAQWLINGVNYFISSSVNVTVPYCQIGKNRIDILVANTSNQIVLIQGIETTEISIRPNIPINTVLITQLNITDNNILGFEPVEIPVGIVKNKGLLNPTTTTITAVANETHLYFISSNGTVNETLPVKVGDIIGINSGMLWLESNNNQTLQNVLDSMDSGIQVLLELSSGKHIDLTDGFNNFIFSPQLIQLQTTDYQFSVGNFGFYFTDFNKTSRFNQNGFSIHDNITGFGHNVYGQDATQDNEIYLPNKSGVLIVDETIIYNTETIITGVASRSLLATIPIPAKWAEIGTIFSIQWATLRNPRANTCSHEIHLGSVADANRISIFTQASNNGYLNSPKHFKVTASGLEGLNISSFVTGEISSSLWANPKTFNPNVANNLHFTITPGATTDSLTNKWIIIKKLN